jgi:restriction endonuclease
MSEITAKRQYSRRTDRNRARAQDTSAEERIAICICKYGAPLTVREVAQRTKIAMKFVQNALYANRGKKLFYTIPASTHDDYGSWIIEVRQ